MVNASTQARIDKLKPKVDPKPVVASSITGQLGSTPTKTPAQPVQPATTGQVGSSINPPKAVAQPINTQPITTPEQNEASKQQAYSFI